MKIKKIKKKLSFLKWIDPFTYADLLIERLGWRENQPASWIIYLFTAFFSAYLLYFVLGLLFQSPSPMVIVVSGSMEPTFSRGDVMVLFGTNGEQLTAPLVELPKRIENMDLSRYAVSMCSVKGQADLTPCRALSTKLASGALEEQQVKVEKIVFPSINKEVQVTKRGDVVVYFSETRGIPIIHRAVTKIHAEDSWFLLTKGDSKYNSFIDQDTALSPNGAVKVSEIQGRVVFMIPKIGYVKLILLDDIPCFLMSPFTGAKCVFP